MFNDYLDSTAVVMAKKNLKSMVNYDEENSLDGKNSELKQVLPVGRLIQFGMHKTASFKSDDIRVLYCYFKDDKESPTPKLVNVLDTTLSHAITHITSFSDKVSIVIDYDIRQFLQDPIKVKRVLIEVMMKNPELIPPSWGGEYCISRSIEKKKVDEKAAANAATIAAAAFAQMEAEKKPEPGKLDVKKQEAKQSETKKRKKKDNDKTMATIEEKENKKAKEKEKNSKIPAKSVPVKKKEIVKPTTTKEGKTEKRNK
ncbi:unnamed protein product [Caenorhabditis bovis]|uniref:DUF7774 domain-containing protein n=1 Tax=Caenorhabditis bovis TaxID=2654633 RepID=A0A8S1EWP4_9PELO|nr:unnamed protein product [Caenorhabditis bovis]